MSPLNITLPNRSSMNISRTSRRLNYRPDEQQHIYEYSGQNRRLQQRWCSFRFLLETTLKHLSSTMSPRLVRQDCWVFLMLVVCATPPFRFQFLVGMAAFCQGFGSSGQLPWVQFCSFIRGFFRMVAPDSSRTWRRLGHKVKHPL